MFQALYTNSNRSLTLQATSTCVMLEACHQHKVLCTISPVCQNVWHDVMVPHNYNANSEIAHCVSKRPCQKTISCRVYLAPDSLKTSVQSRAAVSVQALRWHIPAIHAFRFPSARAICQLLGGILL